MSGTADGLQKEQQEEERQRGEPTVECIPSERPRAEHKTQQKTQPQGRFTRPQIAGISRVAGSVKFRPCKICGEALTDCSAYWYSLTF